MARTIALCREPRRPAAQASQTLMGCLRCCSAVVALLAAPFFFYPVFLMKVLCFALFACAFNLLLGYVGLLSFGHAAFFGGAAYVTAHAVKVWGLPPELGILLGVAGAAAARPASSASSPSAARASTSR